MINREDMLELTRRMNESRNSMDRIAGAYMDRDGCIDDTFNVHFKNLKGRDLSNKLSIAKEIPFAQTNVKLKEYSIRPGSNGKGSIWELLDGLKRSGLKDDALAEIFYEVLGETYHASGDYAIFLFHGCYDIPRKTADKEWLEDSEEVYEYLICAICPLYEDYDVGLPECGFLYPAFKDRSEDWSRINVYQEDPDHPHRELLEFLTL